MPLIIRSFLESEGGGGGSMHVDTLTITTQPTKTTYIQGEKIDTTGMVVNATAYNMSGNVTQYCTVSPQTLSTAGTQTITVSFGDAEATYTVTVEELVSVSITTPPTTTDYLQGAALDLTGIVVTANSATLSRNVTTSCVFEPANGSILSETGSITVTASFGGMSDTTSVTSYAIESIAITTPPTKTKYAVDDELDLTGIVVSGIAGTLTTDVTSQCTFSPVNGTILDTAGTITITATYQTFTATTSILVSSIGTLEDTDWQVIQSVGRAGIGSQYWSIGDTKTITLDGTIGALELSDFSCKVYIIDFNYRDDNGIYFHGYMNTEETKNMCFVDSYYNQQLHDGTKCLTINHWGTGSSPFNTTYGGWKGCDLRYDILGSTNIAPSNYGSVPTTSRVGYDATNGAISNPVPNTFMSALPSDLRAVLAPWTIYTDNVGNASNQESDVTTSVDYLPFLSEYEVFGSRRWANMYEYTNGKQAQMSYYKNNYKVKRKHSNLLISAFWATRSTSFANVMGWCYVYDNESRSLSTDYCMGIAPAFRVA